MAHWAKLDSDNKVIEVIVTNNSAPDEGESFVNSLGGKWVKTSYNAEKNGFRKHFAGIGYTYDKAKDAFIPPKPFDSWLLDEKTLTWKAPVARPGFSRDPNAKQYNWDEETTSWKEVTA